jgi:hypothetical protein
MTWLKDKWEWVVAGLVTILAFVLGSRGKNSAKRRVNLKDKEILIQKEACERELAASQAAAEKHADELKRVHKEADEKLKAAEEEKKQLVKHLKENPDAIDEKLKGLGIKEV